MVTKPTLNARERTILGKKVKNLRRDGFIPAHIFGHKLATDHIAVSAAEFKQIYNQVGETGLLDLKVGEGKENVRPVLVRDVQLDPVKETPLHIDFYQVNLLEKVRVSVPVEVVGEEPESVKGGETVVIQPLGEIEVEALPTDIPEKIEVDISQLLRIDDAVLVSQLKVPSGVVVLTDPEAVVVKLDTAVSTETKRLMEEQAAEAAAAAAAQAPAEEVAVEGEAAGETPKAGKAGEEEAKEEEVKKEEAEKPPEEPKT